MIKTFTASDGYRWSYRHYQPQGEERSARIVAIHGIQSHGGWYERSCQFLSDSGFPVYFLDRRGSGLNEEARGDTPGFRRLLSDIAEFIESLKEENQAKKTFLLAISWGGKIATAFQRRYPGLCDGLALLCPGFYPSVGPSLGGRLRILFSRLIRPRRLFPVPLSEPTLFTETPRWLEFLKEDELSLRKATARFFVESVRLDMYLRWVPKHVKVPVLMMLAEKDRIIQNEPTRKLLDRFASEDRTLIEYPGAHHTLEFEENPEPFLHDLRDWFVKKS